MKAAGQVGITGGIGAGKSIVARVFSVLGIPIYDADSRAKALMVENDTLRLKIIELFGDESFENDVLNRSHISKIAFYEPDKLKQLNEAVHPSVGMDYQEWHQRQNTVYTLKEAALLFEAGSYKQLDKIITVTCPQDVRIQRVLQRDPQRSPEDVQRIIEKQWSEGDKVSLSDYIVTNDDSKSVIKQVLAIDAELRKLFG
jgi:dephospho-CoA kinase